jgi:sporulation protein YlmC with PRC-barrel domain
MYDEDLMNRERMDRDYRDFDERDRGAFFADRDRHHERERGRGRIGGWGGLMRDESSGGSFRDQERTRGLSVRDRSTMRREKEFGPDDYRNDIPRDETERLIASNKVEGTPVYDRNGEKLGTIHNFMVDKFRGNVVYAVLKYSSGFLGLDDRYYPIDWDQLTYDTRLGGYHVQITEDQLKNMGSWDKNQRWSGRMDHERDRERMSREDRGRMDHDRDYQRSSSRDVW